MSERAEATEMVFWEDANDTEARKRYQTLVNTIDEGIYQLDAEGYFVAVNDVIVELTGYAREELLDEHVSVLLEDGGSRFEREIERVYTNSSEQSELLELTVRTAEGIRLPCEVRVSPLEANGSITGIVGTVRDITERKRKEQRVDLLKRLDQALRPVTDPDEIASTAAQLLGEYLDVDWCGYVDVAADEDHISITGDHASGDTERSEGRWAIPEFDDEMRKRMRNDQACIVDDVDTDERLSEAARDTYEQEGIRSIICVPLHVDETLTAGMVAHQETPREWQSYEIDLLSTVVERCWESLQQAQSMRQLRKREEHLNALIKTTPECIKTVAADGSLLQMNPAGLDMIDAGSSSKVVGESVYDLIAPEHLDRFREFNEKICRGESGTLEFDIIGLEGRRLHMESHAAPLRKPDGTTAHVALTRDVTEQKQREQFLEDSKARFEAATEAGAVGTWEWNIPENETIVNESFAQLFGVDPDAAREGVSSEQFISGIYEADRDRIKAKINEAIEECGDFEEEFRVQNADGELRWMVARGHIKCDEDGNPVRFPGALTDITERKEKQQQLEEMIDKLETSNERLEQFAYAASHDLQEPLRMVSSYLQLIEQRYADELDADGQEFIDFAVDGAERMRKMIDALLKYSRVETRGNPFESVELDTVLEHVCEDLQMRIKETDAEITAGSLPCIEGDEEQLRQVFQNLLDNAIEYSGDGPPVVDVSAERNGAEWTISVSDDGIGIDVDNTDRVFEVFESLHSPNEHTGAGIGLAICERIVERHGGEIWVESGPDEGSTFSFTLPAGSAHKGQPTSTQYFL